MADNADITQSQARDTRHRQMQKVNRLYTHSFQLNTVLWSFHTIQPTSYLCLYLWCEQFFWLPNVEVEL